MAHGVYLRELGITLHERLSKGPDGRVTAEIAEVFLPLLVSGLRKRFPNLPDPHQLETAAADTIMAYLEDPEKFDPAKASLLGYLYMAARANLLDFLKGAKKFVELDTGLSEHEVSTAIGGDNPERALIDRTSPLVQRVFELVTDAIDREIVLMMMDGVRQTARYAAVLGIEDRPIDEQAQMVKQHKDRLKKTITRKVKR